MPTFREVLRAAEITIKDNTSGHRMHEIEKILREHHAFSGLTPEKATAILEDLGPTFVTMGQIASNRSDVIPKAYADAFKTLRANVAPVPFEVVVQTMEDSLGHPWRETFADIEEKPWARPRWHRCTAPGWRRAWATRWRRARRRSDLRRAATAKALRRPRGRSWP